MANPKGFIEVKRKEAGNRPVEERIDDYGEVEQTLNAEDRRLQASRCMDCGVPFCHWACPVSSLIPEWQDALYKGNLQEAVTILQGTNEFPEFTGRVCPALCEKSCVLAIHEEAVTIRENEVAIIERAFEKGLIVPKPPVSRTGKKVAVVGSGPAGLTIAARLNRMGHEVVVFEKEPRAGGLLRYGIPDFKLNKKFIDRRLAIFSAEGIVFRTGVEVGKDMKTSQLLEEYDAVVLAIGAMKPRDVKVPGRELEGIHFAMDFLVQQNKVLEGIRFSDSEQILATGKNVIVIGGGDTGSDCVGTSIRQKAKSVTQIELLPQPPEKRTQDNPWPFWPKVLKTSSSHEEGCVRLWGMETLSFEGENGKLKNICLTSLKWTQQEDMTWAKEAVPGGEMVLPADLVLLAVGFVSPVHEGLLTELAVDSDKRMNVQVNENHMTNIPGVFAAGDAASGASLVVRAISDAIDTAVSVNSYLMKS